MKWRNSWDCRSNSLSPGFAETLALRAIERPMLAFSPGGFGGIHCEPSGNASDAGEIQSREQIDRGKNCTGERSCDSVKKARVVAIEELLSILAANPEGMTTSELSGTPRFHGERTLRNPQIIRLLRTTGKVRELTIGHGIRTATLWRLK